MLHALPRRSRWWVAFLQVVLLLVTFAIPAAAAPDPGTLTGSQLIDVLVNYRVVRGDQTGNLNLDKPITRAEMITIMVRALGKEGDADLYKGVTTFSDAKGHWAEGAITVAELNHLVKGDDNHLVRPNDPINYAEALTLLLRVLGQEPTTGSWPTNILMAAADLKLVPDGVNFSNIKTPAIRGLVFASLGKGLTTVKAPSGKTFLAEYLDKDAPLLSVDSVTSPTNADKVTVSGTAKGATAVTVNGAGVALTGDRFTASVDLTVGTNTVTVKATDFAGNDATKTLSITRSVKVARIEVTGPGKVNVGESIKVTATAYDNNNNIVTDTPVTVAVSGNVGTYDKGTATFTAANTTGTATLTFKAGDVTATQTISVLGPSAKVAGLFIVPPSAPLNPNTPGTVEVRVLDKDGNIVTDDNGRQIGITASGLAGITVTPTIAKTVNGVATFSFAAANGGVASLIAATSTLPSASAQVTVATPIRIMLSASPTSLYANASGSTQIRASMVDSNGTSVINNTTSDIVVQLSRSGIGDGNLSPNLVTIKPGRSTSEGYDAIYTAGFTPGSLFVNGSVIAGAAYTVIGTTVTLNQWSTGLPTGGTGGGTSGNYGPASRMQFIGTIGPVIPDPNQPVEIVLRVIDSYGNSVLSGNYPFTLKVSTSNNDPVGANGLPAGVSLTLGSTSRVPIGGTTGVVGVTVNGVARIHVAYNKSGTVRIEPVGANATNIAYDDQGNVVSTTGYSTGLGVAAHTLSFSTGSSNWSTIGLTASYNNSNQTLSYAGATNAPVPTSATVTLTASLKDNSGGVVPDGRAASVRLWKVGDTSAPVATKTISAGTVDFTVQAPTTAGTVSYVVKTDYQNAEIQSATPVTLRVVSAPVPVAPVVNAVRGADLAGNAHDPNKVGLNDSYLQFVVNPTGTSQYGVIKVYRAAGYTPLYTTGVLDLSTVQVVNVPRSLLLNQDAYRLTFDNGAGNSTFSATTATVTLGTQASVGISGATYDAGTHKLTIYTGAYYNASIYPSKLTLTAPGGQTFTPAVGKVDGTGTFVIDLTNDLNLSALETSSNFSGDVRLTTIDNWYERYDGALGSAITAGVSVGPFATITAAYIDSTATNRRLIIDTVGVGANGTTGYLDLSKITVGDANSTVLTLDSTNYTYTADSSVPGRFIISMRNLPTNLATAFDTYHGQITAGAGWYYTGYNPIQKVAGDTAPVYAQVSVNSATYGSGVLSITGSGFLTAVASGITASQISIVDEGVNPVVTVQLTDPNNTVQIVNDNLIQITLGATDAGRMAPLNGSLVFLRTGANWLVDRGGRAAIPVTGYRCGVGFSN